MFALVVDGVPYAGEGWAFETVETAEETGLRMAHLCRTVEIAVEEPLKRYRVVLRIK